MEELLRVEHIDKSFGPTKALQDVSITIHRGEVHGLIGENGSGKSTVSSIIAGIQKADRGVMVFKGEEHAPASSLEANEKGICMLLQEKGTYDNVSVASNIFMGKEKAFEKHGMLSLREMYRQARIALDNVGATMISEKASVASLTFEERKLVEIARALQSDPDILIVDETTTALSRFGRDLLYKQLEVMKQKGKSAIFISHDIAEVKEICDYLTVLRDGHMIQTLEKKDFSDKTIRNLMVGRDVGENFYRTDDISSRQDDIAVKMEHVYSGILQDISLELHKGEILGIGGLTDCGMHDLGKIMYGLIKVDSGKVMLGDGTVIKDSVQAKKAGMGYVAKDRDAEALMTGGSIMDNICSPSLKKIAKKSIITSKAERNFADEWAGKMSVKMQNVKQHVSALSGGNKQKVSLAKWMGYDPDVYIFDCPTRGIDIGVKAAIYQLLMELKAEGKAVLMISEEMMEVIGLSDRIIIIKDGKISGEFGREEKLTEQVLIEYVI